MQDEFMRSNLESQPDNQMDVEMPSNDLKVPELAKTESYKSSNS